MCGIAGIYNFNESKNETLSPLINKLTESIYHRGPDSDGKAIFKNAAIGMRRLSIIDLENGDQPIYGQNRNLVIVFNGEIYNYRQVREKLVQKGAKFTTDSDTEVILNGFEILGEKILDLLEGMFSIAIYNIKEHTLFLARDRLGKKPLYYYRTQDQLIFCSETQGLIKALSSNALVNSQSYWDYLTYRYVPGQESILSGVEKLPPGHFAYIKNGNMKITCYWEIPKSIDPKIKNQDVQKNFSSMFEDSVQKRLVADVEVGVVLSGGLDSCAVLYEAAKDRQISSYHVFFDIGENYNELKYAEMMAKAVNSPLKTVKLDDQTFLDHIESLSRVTDEPISDLSSIPFKHVCDLASKDLKVVLSGEGSDEVLAGYGLHNFYKMYSTFKKVQTVPGLTTLAKAVGKALMPNKNWSLIDVPANNLAKEMNYNITYQMGQDEKAKIALNPENFQDSRRYLTDVFNSVSDQDSLNQILHVITKDWLVENVLMKSDKVSMSSSLEVRCPFLDHKLVEYMFKVPGHMKVGKYQGKLETKILLRKHLEGKIPQEIITRKKLGFPVPAYALLNEKYKSYVFDKLSQSNSFYQNHFRKKDILSLFDKAIQESATEETKLKHFLWTIVNFENWVDNNKSYLRV